MRTKFWSGFITLLEHWQWLCLFKNSSSNLQGQIEFKELPALGRDHTWTGDGFVRANEHTQLVFKIDNLAQSMHYNIIIKYEPMKVQI